MDNNKRKKVVNACDDLANKFLTLATEFKALSKSLERCEDSKEVNLIYKIIKKKQKRLQVYFEEVKGGKE